jgi:hypothetical protein
MAAVGEGRRPVTCALGCCCHGVIVHPQWVPVLLQRPPQQPLLQLLRRLRRLRRPCPPPRMQRLLPQVQLVVVALACLIEGAFEAITRPLLPHQPLLLLLRQRVAREHSVCWPSQPAVARAAMQGELHHAAVAPGRRLLSSEGGRARRVDSVRLARTVVVVVVVVVLLGVVVLRSLCTVASVRTVAAEHPVVWRRGRAMGCTGTFLVAALVVVAVAAAAATATSPPALCRQLRYMLLWSTRSPLRRVRLF